jgi:hypothetical protein
MMEGIPIVMGPFVVHFGPVTSFSTKAGSQRATAQEAWLGKAKSQLSYFTCSRTDSSIDSEGGAQLPMQV